MKLRRNKRGQALLELAIFGSLILFLFGILLSYMQRMNDQQYVQMEAFRQALRIGNTDNAAAQLTVLENRRHVDLGNYFMKGSPQSLSASSNVFWAVPKVGSQPEQRAYVKVNEDYSSDLAGGEGLEDIQTSSETEFNEIVAKQETPQAISNIKSSTLKDTITTTLVGQDKSPIWQITQGLYRDSDGQYKYSSSAVGTEVKREQSWQTGF
jgi:uncharacterized protein (UPF0333 family)